MKTMKSKTKKTVERVMVTDNTRGVCWGEIVKKDVKNKVIILKNVRHCFYYSAGHGNEKGIGSLATVGPQPGSKIGPMFSQLEMFYEKIFTCSETANENWRAAIWG